MLTGRGIAMKVSLSLRHSIVACGCLFLVCTIMHAIPASSRAQPLFHPRFEVFPEGLRIKGDLYGRTIPFSALQLPLARIVDLDQERELRPWLKVNGVGLPSYRSGWFRLKDRERALLFLTDRHRAVYIPTNLGYSLLISPDQPVEFLAALQRPPANGQAFSIAKNR